MIKEYLDAAGEAQKIIYELACANDRAIVERRCEREVGTKVDVASATYTNDIGDALVGAFWEDPDFDPAGPAWYYVRVIEIPEPRWRAYDQIRFGIEMADDVPMTVQDRAYTSGTCRSRHPCRSRAEARAARSLGVPATGGAPCRAALGFDRRRRLQVPWHEMAGSAL